MVNVVCKVYMYEVDGQPQYDDKGAAIIAGHFPAIDVETHYSKSDLIVLIVEGRKYTVAAKDLAFAISCCENANSDVARSNW